MAANDPKMYDALNNLRLELKADIATMNSSLSSQQGRLEKKFDDLEAGRLTRLESEVAVLRSTSAIADGNRLQWKNWIVPAVLYVIGQIVLVYIIKRLGS